MDAVIQKDSITGKRKTDILQNIIDVKHPGEDILYIKYKPDNHPVQEEFVYLDLYTSVTFKQRAM